MFATKNFKLPKRTKTLIALLQHAKPEMRSTFKAMMIDGQLSSGTRSTSDRK